MIERLVTRPLLPLAIALAIVAPLAAGLGGLTVRNDIASWFSEGDPALLAYQDFIARFGSDETVVLMSESAGDVARWARALEDIDGVERSLSSATLKTRDVRLVGRDGAHSVVYLWLDAAKADRDRARILDEIAKVNDEVWGTRVHMGGGGVLFEAINQMTMSDGALFIGLAYVLVIACMAWLTRRFLWVCTALVVVTAVDLALFGAMGHLGIPVNAVNASLPTLAMVISVANVIHVALAIERDSSASAAIRSRLAALAFNALTTSAALLSLLSASMGITRELGLLAALAVLLSFLLSLLLCAAVATRAGSRSSLHKARGRRLARASALAYAHPRATVAIFAALSLAAASFAMQVEVDTETMSFLDEEHTVRADHRVIEAALGPYLGLELLVESDDWRDPKTLRALGHATRELNATSVSTLLDLVATEMSDEAVELDDDRAIAQWLALLEMERPELLSLVVDDNTLRVTVPLALGSAREMSAAAASAREVLEANRLNARVSGYLPLYSAMTDDIVRDQALSFSIAFACVFALLCFWLRDRTLFFAALIANLFPVLLTFGVMGALRLRLDVATVSVAAIILGIVVDDSVHLLSALKAEKSVVRATSHQGLAIVTTSVILASGFLVIAFSSLRSMAWMGILCGVAIVSAAIADLVFLPALLGLMRKGRP